MKKAKGEKTRGDVLKLNITPSGPTFPLILIFLYEYGIKKGSGIDVGLKIGATKAKSRTTLARELGEGIIDNSKILSAWFNSNK